MKRFALIAKDSKGILRNIFKDNRTFKHKHTARNNAEQMSVVIDEEIIITEVEVVDEIESLRIKLNTCKNDYNFMINLIEKYGTDKDQTLKDILERMKFRKPMFEGVRKWNSHI